MDTPNSSADAMQIEEPSPACQATLEAVLDSQPGEGVGLEAGIHAHVQKCAYCQAALATASSLKQAIATEAASLAPGFTQKVMQRLPPPVASQVSHASQGAASTQIMERAPSRSQSKSAASSTGLIVIARPERRSWRTALVAIAALLFVAVGVALALQYAGSGPHGASANAGVIERGALADAQGNRVRQLQAGQRYTARERAVVAVRAGKLLRIEPGASFEVASLDAEPSLTLDSGDMYASAADSPVPLHVTLKNFDTLLHGGEFFIGQDVSGANQVRGVLIVFSGSAQVRVNSEISMPLKPGQVYYNVEEDGETAADSLPVSEAVAVQSAPLAAPSSKELRNLYADRVRGFEGELAHLREKLAALDADSAQHAECEERERRVQQYLREHRQRLQAMGDMERHRHVPSAQIQRGVNGRTDPATWRM